MTSQEIREFCIKEIRSGKKASEVINILNKEDDNDPIGMQEYDAIVDDIYNTRTEYIQKLPIPKVQKNYFLECGNLTAAGYIAKGIARRLHPKEAKSDTESFVSKTYKENPMKCYDGEPVIIWDGWTGEGLNLLFKDPKITCQVFGVKPNSGFQNRQCGSCNFGNPDNIIISPETFDEFKKNLAKKNTSQNVTEPSFIIIQEDEIIKWITNTAAEGKAVGAFKEYISYRQNLGHKHG